jgi:hypothetical protein
MQTVIQSPVSKQASKQIMCAQVEAMSVIDQADLLRKWYRAVSKQATGRLSL